MRDELIEVAAMATADALWNDGRIGFTCKKGDLVAVMKDAATTALDAILDKLSEPSEEMLAAGKRPERKDPLGHPGMSYMAGEVDAIFRAMLATVSKGVGEG